MNWKALIVLCAIVLATSDAALAQSSLNSKDRTSQDRPNPVGQTRVAECDQLIEIANRATDAVQRLSQHPSADSAQDLLQTAVIAEQATSEMKTLRLTDRKLSQFREQYITMYTGTSQASRDLAAAANRQDKAAAQQAFTALQTATAAEDDLVPAINTYCKRTTEAPRPN